MLYEIATNSANSAKGGNLKAFTLPDSVEKNKIMKDVL